MSSPAAAPIHPCWHIRGLCPPVIHLLEQYHKTCLALWVPPLTTTLSAAVFSIPMLTNGSGILSVTSFSHACLVVPTPRVCVFSRSQFNSLYGTEEVKRDTKSLDLGQQHTGMKDDLITYLCLGRPLVIFLRAEPVTLRGEPVIVEELFHRSGASRLECD